MIHYLSFNSASAIMNSYQLPALSITNYRQ